jgi:hypothetical protein
MKANETKTVGAATITKQVLRSSARDRGARTFAQGTRQFSETTYIVKLNGRYIGFESTFAAAEKVAKDAQ